MSVILYIVGLIALLVGGATLLSAQSAIHEIMGGVAILVFVAAVGFAQVIAYLKQIVANQEKDPLGLPNVPKDLEKDWYKRSNSTM